MNARVWISLIFVMLHHAVGEETEIHSLLRQIDIEENGPNVSQSEKTRLDEYRKTLIREEILRRLGLDSPPNASHIPHFPKHLIEKVLRQTAPDGEEHPQKAAQKQIITMAEADSSGDPEGSLAQLLRFHTEVKLGSILSVTLVLCRNPKVLTKKILQKPGLLTVRIIGHPHRASHIVARPEIIESNRKWVKLDVTSILKSRGGDTMMESVSIEVRCTECGGQKGFLIHSGKRRPFLIFNVQTVSKSRTRRHATCSPQSTSCCLLKYKIKFEELGIPFIIAPNEFKMNYCRGTCSRPGALTIFLRRINVFQSKTKGTHTKPNDKCCVVTRMSPLSILYFQNDQLIKTDLPNMTADGCRCA